MSGTGGLFQASQVTTSQRDAIASPTNGMIVYNSTTGVMNQYIGGAWTTFATGTTSLAANNTAGKLDVATIAEIAAATATDASSGGLNALVVGNTAVNSASANIGSGAIPALGTDSLIDITLGGTKKASFTAYTPICGGTSTTGALQSVASIGSSGQILMSNGASNLPTFQAAQYFDKSVYISGASSATLSNPTSNTAFDTHTYAITANTLIAGVSFEFDCCYTITPGTTSNVTLSIMIGSTVITSVTFAAIGAGANAGYTRGFLIGTAAAGASVPVRAGLIGGMGTAGKASGSYDVQSFATNGSLTMQFGASFGTGDAGNSVILTAARIKKASTTAF